MAGINSSANIPKLVVKWYLNFVKFYSTHFTFVLVFVKGPFITNVSSVSLRVSDIAGDQAHS